MMKVAIIGAGAAGCFCAANLLRMAAGKVQVTVFEAGPKALAKVAITGGGRCNITNSFEGIHSLSEAYPRGERVMKRLLKEFSQEDTVRWFTAAGVPLTLQEDHCWFPVSQDAMDVVRCLLSEMKGADLRLKRPVSEVQYLNGSFLINDESFSSVVITTGGMSPRAWKILDIDIVPPVPSLFTFNIKDKALNSLMGIVTEAAVSIPVTRYKASGALLITDWGLSGPAALKLSSYAARYLSENSYKAPLSINWMNESQQAVREMLQETAAQNPGKLLRTTHLLPGRLWGHILRKAGLEERKWGEMGVKALNKLTETLTNDNYFIEGKSKFREEFVTCGGVSLDQVNPSTLESRKYPGLYFAGEVLDIDAITGGFNLQAAWSSGYVVAKNIGKRL